MIILFDLKNNILRFYKEEDVLDELYYLGAELPKEDIINKYLEKSNEKIKQYFKKYGISEAIWKIKQSISKLNYKIPLYDEYSKNLYLINKENVYYRVVHQSYRFPDEDLIAWLYETKTSLEQRYNLSEDMINVKKRDEKIELKTISKKRQYKKLVLMLLFLKQFDIKTLKTTYIEVFYYYANEVGKNITNCLRPSFLPHFGHINPYYTRSELINLSLNMELIKPSSDYINTEQLDKLCKLVKESDINAENLIKHEKYIIEQQAIGTVQFFSFQGSYLFNQYLRQKSNSTYKNDIVESNIINFWNLILEAPPFDKSYILYRFVKNDSYIENLKIGDIYRPDSFLSTTRDPFFHSNEYKFGFILIKIRIPGNVNGVGLAIETLSNFPKEQEIILPPLCKLKLLSRDENAVYFHTDESYSSQVKKRYEFIYIGTESPKLVGRSPFPDETLIDFFKLDKKQSALTLEERLSFFTIKYLSPLHNFRTQIGDQIITVMAEIYDSTGPYKKFYANETNKGFSFYTLIDGFLGFLIEVGNDGINNFLYVNYYLRYSSVPTKGPIPDKYLIPFLASMAYYFEISNVVIFANYSSCDLLITKYTNNNEQIYSGGNYCTDFYDYLKNNDKRFKDLNFDTVELKPKFSYYELNRLKDTDPLKVLSIDDRDEIYQIYTKYYQPLTDITKYNILEFYLWLMENYCVYINFLHEKMSRIYNENNPFTEDYYVLDVVTYLYNRNIIRLMPSFYEKSDESQILNTIPKNVYRTDKVRNNRFNL